MRILFVGDVVGRPGRRILSQQLQNVIINKTADLTIVNCENAASGFGVTPDIAEALFEAGADVLTSGNHIWDKKAIFDYIAQQPRLLRPANYPDAPGGGLYVGLTKQAVRYAVLNLQGRTYLPAINCPFRTADALVDGLADDVRVRFVDFHAEATSEKAAFGWHLDGRVSAVVGTHTHIPTADERLLPGGTAYLTDVGMTGPVDSIIGMDRETSLQRFLTGMPVRFEPATGRVRLSSVIVDVEDSSGRALAIERHIVESES